MNDSKTKIVDERRNSELTCLFSFLYFLVVLSVYTERDPHQSIVAQVFCAL